MAPPKFAGHAGKALRQLLAQEPGWVVSPTRSGHWKLIAPSGAIVFTSGTPSDHRTLKNLRAQMHRALRQLE